MYPLRVSAAPLRASQVPRVVSTRRVLRVPARIYAVMYPYYNAPILQESKTPTENVQYVSTQKKDIKMLTAPDIATSPFEKLIIDDQLERVVIGVDRKTIKYQLLDGTTAQTVLEKPVNVGLIDLLVEHGVPIRYDNQQDFVEIAKAAGYILTNALYWMIGIIIIYTFFSQRGGGGGGPLSQLRGFTAAKSPIDPKLVNVEFKDVAGLETAKLELMEVVEFLKSPEKFVKMGAKIPKGCLLSGGPGLGKTLLAKAVAGEANVPFYAISASSLVEIFVGVGASRIRSLFEDAKKNSPCIIFFDEIDAVGKARSANTGFGSNDEREQTINQLLTEMDGFNENSGVVVIGATNRPDVLDPALLRPGRFDRTITLDPPTLKDREAILDIHTKGKPLAEDVNLADIAKNTVGLSGAELANIANEAAILAARRDAERISDIDFKNAIDRVLLGPEKTNTLISEKKKRVVAAHEAGHAVVGLKVGEYDTVTKISIVPRGKAGGVTMFEQLADNAESGLYSKRYLENRLAVALGGRAAEEIVFGEQNITTGAYSDMEEVQKLARAMIVNYGYSPKLGPVSWSSKDAFNKFSNSTIYEIDKEVIQLTKKAYERSKNIISQNGALFNDIAEQLYHKEVLNRSQIQEIASKYS